VRDDEELMLEAVQLKGSTLQYASERLGAKKAFVLHAVNQDGFALGHAAQALWADRDLVLASYRGKAAFLGRMSTWSEKDWDRFREGLSIIGYRDDIPAELREDPEVVVAYYAFRACTMVNMEEYIFLPKKLTGDGELIAQLLDLKVFLPLWSLSRAVRSNRALALRAIRLLASNLKYAAAALRNDPSFVLEAFALNAYCLRYAPRWMLNHKPFMLKACQMHEIALRWASPRLQKDPEVVARAVQYHPDAIQYAAWALYEEFVRAHPAARVPEHVGEGRDSVTSDSSDDGFWQRQSWSKTRAAGRSVANSRFALKALLRRAVTGKL